jgi:hypothetical protein
MTTTTHSETAPRPLYERALRVIVVGTFSVIVLYLRILAGLINLVIRAIQKIPMNGKRAE